MTLPFAAGPQLPETLFKEVRLRAIFDCFKWDPQAGDISVLAPFPIVLPRNVWAELTQRSEALARETIAAEIEILARPELLKNLALPRAIWKLLAAPTPAGAPRPPRVMRFDFHFTTEGWRISEVNSDVPGGFVEADGFTQLMADACGGLEPTGRPAARLAQTLVRSAGVSQPVIALVHASAYSDDRQVVAFLARELEKLGATAILIDPSQLLWRDCGAFVRSDWFNGEIRALYRFFPAEWLPNLGRTSPWQHYFSGETIPQCNPGLALVSQSKRFGILLSQLETPAPNWKTLLPPTCDVRAVDPAARDWVFKPALGRVGEAIGLDGVTPENEAKQIRRNMFFFPGHWVAQRRFESIPVPTPAGPQHVCLGVYTIDGLAAGIYGRCAPRPIIDHTARDLAILLKD